MNFNKPKLCTATIIFLFGLYFCANYSHQDLIENFENAPKPNKNIPEDCPNLLVQKGSQLQLLNTKKAIVPGVNPIIFKDLGEYLEYAKWQQKVNSDCPILYFQQTFDVQGKRGYRRLEDPLMPGGGVVSELLHNRDIKGDLDDAGKDKPPYNENQFASYDNQDQNIGRNTILDENFITGGGWNPMQPDWKGMDRSEGKALAHMADRRDQQFNEKNMASRLDRIATETQHIRPIASRKFSKKEDNVNDFKIKQDNSAIKAALYS
jgi:hypothetical protein